MAEIVKGKHQRSEIKRGPETTNWSFRNDKNTVFLRTVKSKSGKETKVKCKIILSIVVVLCCFHIASTA